MTEPYALRNQILRVTADSRRSVMLASLRAWLAQLSNRPESHLSAGTSLTELNEVWQDNTLLLEALQPYLRQQIGLTFGPREFKGKQTVGDLVDFLLVEIEALSAPTAMYSDLYAQGRWAWRPPAPYPEEIQEKQRLVFVVGSGRSGTTLLRTMLAGHPALFAPPELNLLPFDSMGAARNELNRLGVYGLRYGLIQTIAHLEQLSMEEATARVKKLEDQDVPIPAVYRLLEERSGNRRLVDKSPIYAFHEAWLQRAEQIFDRPNYLFIFRHPYAVIDSIVRRRYSRLLPNLWGVWDENPWLYAEKIWTVLNWNVITFLKSIPAERQYHIPYEKLVTDKQGQLQAICQSLNIDFDAALLDPYAGNRMMSGVGDIYMKKRGRVDANLADAWRKQRPPQRLSDFTRQVAAHLGYEISP